MAKATVTLEQESFLRLVRVQDRLGDRASALLKPYGLSQSQYNVLRILRGAGPAGLPCQAIGDRMISRVPDITRLLDRLETTELIERGRSETDRRVVITRISAKGMALLTSLDRPVRQFHEKQFAALAKTDLKRLHDLLGKFLDSMDP